MAEIGMRVYCEDGEYEVWIGPAGDLESGNIINSFIAGVGVSRDEAVGNAVRDLEALVEHLQAPLVSPAKTKQKVAQNMLTAPCRWCGYNGPDYWQKGTHATDCPWWRIGGEVDRERALVAPAPIKRADEMQPVVDELRRRMRVTLDYDLASQPALFEIGVMAMTAQSDPNASAEVYRKALIDICNHALASQDRLLAVSRREHKER